MQQSVLDNLIDQLNGEFGTLDPITVCRGDVHEYLGMTLDFSEPKTLKVLMQSYIEDILAEVPEDMGGTARTPAASHLFKINDRDPVHLDPSRAETYHRIVMQISYLSQRARPDLKTAVSFLSTRVANPDEDDYKKLSRLVRYMRRTKSLPLRLRASDANELIWSVDASYATHDDMKGHTGGSLTLGEGCVWGTSKKQNLVARSTTESEPIGVHDVLPQIIWTNHFLQAQGLHLARTVLQQDSKSAILLEENGRFSSTKRTKHINIKYHHFREAIADGRIEMKAIDTKQQQADIFTKPLDETTFVYLRKLII